MGKVSDVWKLGAFNVGTFGVLGGILGLLFIFVEDLCRLAHSSWEVINGR